MNILDIELKIISLADKHKKEIEDEFAFYYEIEAYDTILEYLLNKNIQIGDYNLSEIFEQNTDDEFERAELLYELQEFVLNENNDKLVNPEAIYLFDYHKKTFWPDM